MNMSSKVLDVGHNHHVHQQIKHFHQTENAMLICIFECLCFLHVNQIRNWVICENTSHTWSCPQYTLVILPRLSEALRTSGARKLRYVSCFYVKHNLSSLYFSYILFWRKKVNRTKYFRHKYRRSSEKQVCIKQTTLLIYAYEWAWHHNS
jgi:hypothetical protein